MLARLIYYCFARSRLRKGPDIDPKLKNLGSLYDIKKKVKEYRQEFETTKLNETFTDAINTKKPVLKKRFKIDEAKLSKHLKKVVNKMITPQALSPASDEGDDLRFLNQSKSYIHDQRIEVDFEQKFRKELFMRKQTDRMLKKEERNFKNFLPENAGNKYNAYIDAKTKLKNSRIDSMMNYKRNNQELQLLIESGFIDEPQNIRIVIDKISGKEGTKQIEQQQLQEKGLAKVQDDGNQSFHRSSLQQEMMTNIVGPEQTRDFQKIQKFLQMYESNSEEAKKKAAEDVGLLMKIKEYQRNLFLSRYDQINFRFRGRVNFDYFKEYQLLSYIKNQTIEPKDLLAFYDSNKELLSKFKVPIVTPAVMSRVYAKTSTYKFSQNDQNNHINMLNDPIFKSLESSLFRELDKISDELFCDTVWAYSKNHELERGMLNLKKAEAIQKAIFSETCQRVNRLRQPDLGLLVRSLMKLPLLKAQHNKNQWGEVIEALEHRLPLMQIDYEVESVMQFVTMLPVSATTINLLARNIKFFKKYQWQQTQTLFAFTRVCSALIRHQHLIDPFEHNKTFIVLKEIIAFKVQQIKTIIPHLSINDLSKNLIVFQQLNKFPFGPSLPVIIMNVAKKEIVDSIHMQKHKIYQYTIPTLISTLSAYDYYQNLIKSGEKYIDMEVLVKPYTNINILKYIPLKSMLPGRVFTFNSQLYFVYHQMARLLQVEDGQLSTKSIADSIFGLSLVQYKNQGIYDTLTYRILQRIQKDQARKNNHHLTSIDVINLMKIVNGYSLQKRTTDVVEEICEKILDQGKAAMKEVQLNIMIRFFGAYINISPQPTQKPKGVPEQSDYLILKWQRNRKFTFAFLYCFKNYIIPFLSRLQPQQLITTYFVQTLILNNISRIVQNNQQLQVQYELIRDQSKQNIQSIINILEKMEEDKIKADYRFVLSLCMELNQIDNCEVRENMKIGSFQKNQRKFYEKHIDTILRNQEHIGVMTPYKEVYNKVCRKLKNQADDPTSIKQKIWRIEDQQNKTVYFFATFEHLMTKHNEQHTSFALFGLWKIYSQIYRRRGWKVELVCSMLQK